MCRCRRMLLLGLVLGGCREAPAPGTEVRVEIAGGASRGVYQASGRELSCAGSAAGPGVFGVQFTDWTGPKDGLRSLSLVLPSAQRPDDFYLGMVFGDFFAGRVIEIDTRAAAPAPRGKGRVIVVPAQGGTAVTVTGETENAVALTATILCLTPVPEKEQTHESHDPHTDPVRRVRGPRRRRLGGAHGHGRPQAQGEVRPGGRTDPPSDRRP